MDELVNSKVGVAIEELINLQKQYAECREDIKNIIKEYISDLTNDELIEKINTNLWSENKTIDENIEALINCYCGYICNLIQKNEDTSKVAKFLYIMHFNG